VFQDNVGLSGGAFHIDLSLNEDESKDPISIYDYSPFVFVQGNHFERNMAYFHGNAIYIKGS